MVAHAGGAQPYNPPNPALAFSNSPLYPAGSALMNTGTGPVWRQYDVIGNKLVATDLVTGKQAEIAANVVNLQAQYGITDGASNDVRSWVDATAGWQNPSAVLVTRIRAIRFAVAVRSTTKEPLMDDAGACATTTAAPTSWPDAPALDLSPDPDWRCYRYQVYASTVPLKNVAWGAAQ